MNCDPEKLEAYHDRELSSLEMQSVEEHLVDCEDCRKELDRTRNLDLLLRKTPPGDMPEEDRYLQEVRRQVQNRRGLSWMGLAALFLLGLTVWNVYDAIRPEAKNPEKMSVRAELIRFSSVEEESARNMILSRLEAKGEPGIRNLVAALDDPDVRVQIAAAQVLSRFRDDRVRDLLLEVAGRSEKAEPESGAWDLEDTVITSCLYRAMEIAERESDPGDLFTMLEDQGGEDPEVLDALSDWVENLLESGRGKLQRLALGILERLGLELPWWSLLPLLDSPECGDRVLEILRLRTGKNFGADLDEWRHYLQEF